MGLLDSIIGAESGGNPNARNPNSSAAGAGQFIDATWMDMLRKYRPDLLENRTPADALALKLDPALSRSMTDAYARENQGILAAASLPVTPGTTYLAHFAGPGGAVKVLSADPNAPAGSILGAAVVKANPFLASMTAGDLRAWADRKMSSGPTPPGTGQGSPSVAPSPTQAAADAPGPTNAPAATPAAPVPRAAAPYLPAMQEQPQPQQAAPLQFPEFDPPMFAQRQPIQIAMRRPVLRGFY